MSSLHHDMFIPDGVASLFSANAQLQGMLDFESALARAEARASLIPKRIASVITAKCDAEIFDLRELAVATARVGNPAIPMVEQLTALVALEDETASRFVHWGATSQDVIDTGMVLQMRGAFAYSNGRLAVLANGLEEMAHRHSERQNIYGAQSLSQSSALGTRAAIWASAIGQHREQLVQLAQRALVVQFGGAAGTLAALGDYGLVVAENIADELQLPLPDLPWHSHRDRIAEVGTTLALLVGTLGGMAQEMSFLVESEVAETGGERNGRGLDVLPSLPGSNAPALVLATANRTPTLAATLLGSMVQEHERAVGGWAAEWVVLPELMQLTCAAIERTLEMIFMQNANLADEGQRRGKKGRLLAEKMARAVQPD